MELQPFDPADYLDSEEAIAAYLAEAHADGGLSDALQVIERARTLHRQRIAISSSSVPVEANMATNSGKGLRHGSVTGRSQFERPSGDWQKRDDRTGQVMERKASEGPFKGVAKEPDGRKG